jgi:hypothetical protein
MVGMNVVGIQQSVSQVKVVNARVKPALNLSADGKNVVVIFLDRALNHYFPYYMAEKPELAKQFDGFTNYTNTVSFAGATNFAVPALVGGYEYTPIEINKRDNETLVSKQNEALRVMPAVFSQNGYDVTVCDPSYANYNWVPDLSIYDEYPEIDAYITKGKFQPVEQKAQSNIVNRRNFFCCFYSC